MAYKKILFTFIKISILDVKINLSKFEDLNGF